jgi:hypothetical protein
LQQQVASRLFAAPSLDNLRSAASVQKTTLGWLVNVLRSSQAAFNFSRLSLPVGGELVRNTNKFICIPTESMNPRRPSASPERKKGGSGGSSVTPELQSKEEQLNAAGISVRG